MFKNLHNFPFALFNELIFHFSILKQQLKSLQISEQDEDIICKLCGKSILKSDYESHKKTEELYLSTLQCALCNMNFNTKKKFRVHLYNQHRQFHCKVCDVTLEKESRYRQHIAAVHKVKKRVKCDLCYKDFTNKVTMERHKRTMHFCIKGNKHKCPQCDFETFNKNYLKLHMDKHEKSPAFVCDMCGDGFYLKRTLLDHLEAAHGSGFKCDVCGKMYTSKGNLVQHLKIHDGIRKFQCEECGDVFMHKKSLEKHVLKHKGMVKTYNCGICGKEITTKRSFDTHMKIHTGVKPYGCEDCGKKFSDKKYLVYHQKHYHK